MINDGLYLSFNRVNILNAQINIFRLKSIIEDIVKEAKREESEK